MAKTQKIRRKKRLFGTPERPRLVVFRSIKHISGQIIDDANQRTLVGAADFSKEIADACKKAGSPVEVSKVLGEFLAKKAKENKIEQVVFDRNGYKYHGRVKALADGAREGGLKF
ncbi:MAG: 50S ribosomal protein L18 [Calditrichaeota bacterium]|nr:50S ribosomal protein L18 [Calditrichota bacterium]